MTTEFEPRIKPGGNTWDDFPIHEWDDFSTINWDSLGAETTYTGRTKP